MCGDVDRYLERGDAWMALSIPARYGESVAAGRPATLQVLADGSDASSTNIAMGYATNLIAGTRRSSSSSADTRAARRRWRQADAGIEPRVRVWFNPTLESRYFMLPGIFALLLLVVTSNLSSMAIVREREVGTLEQLNVTPLGRLELILGKLLPYGVIGLIDVLIVLIVIVFWFEVPHAGKLLAAVRNESHLPAHDARPRTVHLDDFTHAAAGDDDVDVLLPDAHDVSLRVRVSDREHARRRFNRSRISSRSAISSSFFEGCSLKGVGPRNAVAAGARAVCMGRSHPGAGGHALEQATGIGQGDNSAWERNLGQFPKGVPADRLVN